MLSTHRAVSAPEVAQTWPLVVRNAFRESGAAHPTLSISLLITVEQGDSPSCVAVYLVEDLVRSSDGVITGRIVPTNRDYSVFFNEKTVVEPRMIVDWRYAEDINGPRYGDFLARSITDKTQLEASGLSANPVPPHWK
ncbi:hypothetical protein [Cognatiyoonia sp. IB215182]|uniref:hypothetical protein n=1 Tax=Cognatiyoonia sp. IB215182 TaxID=3097353 RepID=UPI002A15C69D|nr:hypothetical protein [Cognatiyoonia sp. IB215182]MDX8351284.1 hypothetical protein [Cognatiyoonia sp. IB215182]